MNKVFPENRENQKLAQRLGLDCLDGSLYFPKFFEIETVNACNARCQMCPIDWEMQKSNVMSEELFAKLVHELAGYVDYVDTIALSRDGEPTLDKNLPGKVKMLKDIGIKKVTFSTNGQLLLPKLIHQLIDAGLDDIMVSIDGVTRETYEAIRNRLNYDVVLENTLNLIRIRNERCLDMTIRVRMVLMEKNQHEHEEWLAFWKPKLSNKDRIYARKCHEWGDQNYIEPEKNIIKHAGKPCVVLFSSMIIKYDGKVPLCSIDYIPRNIMGDFSKQSINEIWRGENFAKVRSFHATEQRNEIRMCCGCNIWDQDSIIETVADKTESVNL